MNNALMKLTQGKAELTEAELMIMAEMEEETAAFDMQPARIKIAPGGIGQFLMGDDTAKTFTGIVAISQKIRGYWPDSSASGVPPICSSPDGARGFFSQQPSDDQFRAAANVATPHPGIILLTESATMPDFFHCARCPMDQWGSGKNNAKGCKTMRRLLILVEGWALPALMSLPPTSIKVWDAYCSALASKRSSYFAVKTKFELDKAQSKGGDTYNVVKVSVAGALVDDLEMLAAVSEIRRQYRELVSGLPVVADEYETGEGDGSADDGSKIVPF